MRSTIVLGVDVSHSRLVDLTRLADQAKPFYDWIEARFRIVNASSKSLDELLLTLKQGQIEKSILACYAAINEPNLPFLFDGVGRSYPHAKACYYIFAWIIRDAPQQRLAPLIQKMVSSSGRNKLVVEAKTLSELIVAYRRDVKTFSWEAIREVIVDRLEGSRRSIKGHEKEIIVRTALLVAIQSYFEKSGGYGRFTKIEIPENQIMIGSESFDVSANLLDEGGNCISRILLPIKTRETEGGGHAHLFSRDITSALNAARFDNDSDFLIAVIVAKNWSSRETAIIRELVDHLAVFGISPNEFSEFSEVEQMRLNQFVGQIFDGKIQPKR